jgi:hypothetical protein
MERNAEMIRLMPTGECDMFDRALSKVSPKGVIYMYCASNVG